VEKLPTRFRLTSASQKSIPVIRGNFKEGMVKLGQVIPDHFFELQFISEPKKRRSLLEQLNGSLAALEASGC